jgi:L-ascorbate metabolism protein UlaG (beta-lactamase superfamily)
MTARALLALVLALPASAQSPEPEAPAVAPAPALEPAPTTGVEVTYLANDGFMLRSGKYTILIDAFVREPVGVFGALPEELHKRLVNALPPFDALTVVLVSHIHGDHLQVRSLEKFLGHNNQAQLLSSEQVLRAVHAGAKDFEAIGKRLTPIPLVKGAMKTLKEEGMSVSFFELAHFNAPLEDKEINLGHLLHLGGLKILHLGDAAPTPETFAAYDLAGLEIDLAIVPYWFFGEARGVKVLHERIRPRQVIMAHIPPANMDKLSGMMQEQLPDVVIFKEAMEKRTFLPVEERAK